MPLDEDALRALARLEEQGLTLAKSLRPGEDAVESAFKPPAKTNHSFIPRKSVGGRRLSTHRSRSGACCVDCEESRSAWSFGG